MPAPAFVVAPSGRHRQLRASLAGAAALAATLAFASPAAATTTTISTDPFTQATCAASSTTSHHTEVEPDTFAFGSTIVAAYQVGRVFNGGGCAIGFSRSSDNGATWTNGLVAGITKWAGGGTAERATDASVAYDAKHATWLISSIEISAAGGSLGVFTSRSTDGGLTWGPPVPTATGAFPDKNWIVCDNTASSPFYGNCYTEWDDFGHSNHVEMNTSTDGGESWAASTSNGISVIGGQPVVRPDGTVIVPTANAYETAVGAFSSTDGGASWGAVTTIATIDHAANPGSLREPPLPSAEIDGAGTVYVVWSDCRFRKSCKVNDLVITHSLDATGTSWTPVTRIPLDATSSGIDHVVPGLAVDRATSGANAHLGLFYYVFPAGSTSLSVGFVSSTNGGGTWSAPQTIEGGMPTTWAAPTSQGYMVGDYISASFGTDAVAHGVFATASAPTTGSTCSEVADNCNEAMSTFAGTVTGGALSGANDPILTGGTGYDNAQSLWKVSGGKKID